MVAPAQIQNQDFIASAIHAQDGVMIERMRHEVRF
jgi:hypothetical protein